MRDPRRELNLALGCGFVLALLVAIVLVGYLWTV